MFCSTGCVMCDYAPLAMCTVYCVLHFHTISSTIVDSINGSMQPQNLWTLHINLAPSMHHICTVMSHLPINDVAIVPQCGSGPSMLTHHSNKHEKIMKFK